METFGRGLEGVPVESRVGSLRQERLDDQGSAWTPKDGPVSIDVGEDPAVEPVEGLQQLLRGQEGSTAAGRHPENAGHEHE